MELTSEEIRQLIDLNRDTFNKMQNIDSLLQALIEARENKYPENEVFSSAQSTVKALKKLMGKYKDMVFSNINSKEQKGICGMYRKFYTKILNLKAIMVLVKKINSKSLLFRGTMSLILSEINCAIENFGKYYTILKLSE